MLESIIIEFIPDTLLDQLLNFILEKQSITTLYFRDKVKENPNFKYNYNNISIKFSTVDFFNKMLQSPSVKSIIFEAGTDIEDLDVNVLSDTIASNHNILSLEIKVRNQIIKISFANI